MERNKAAARHSWLGCCLVSFHFPWAIPCPQAVYKPKGGRVFKLPWEGGKSTWPTECSELFFEGWRRKIAWGRWTKRGDWGDWWGPWRRGAPAGWIVIVISHNFVQAAQQEKEPGNFFASYTQWCIFLSQEVREISRFFVAPPTRVRPRPPRVFHARNSNFYS